MIITKVTQSSIRLDFTGLKAYPACLPSIIYKNVIIVGTNSQAIEYTDAHSIERILAELFAPLSLLEFMLLRESLEKVNLDYNHETLAHAFGFKQTTEFEKIKKHLMCLPLKIRNWFIDKKFSYSDLQPLFVIDIDTKKNAELEQLIQKSGSHSEAVQAFELWVELSMLGYDMGPALVQSDDLSTLLTALKNQRFPLDSVKRLEREQIIKKLPWPKYMNVRSARQGDRAGFEVKFFAHSPTDFIKQIDGLRDVAKIITQNKIERF